MKMDEKICMRRFDLNHMILTLTILIYVIMVSHSIT